MARPKGVEETKPRNTLARRLAIEAEYAGITPLDVMLAAMKEDWEAARAMLAEAKPEDQKEADRWMAQIQALRASAVATADRAAPYLHAKLSSTTLTGANGGPIQTQAVDDRPGLDVLIAAAHAAVGGETKH